MIICYNLYKTFDTKNEKSIGYNVYIFLDKVGVVKIYTPLQRTNFLISKKNHRRVVPFVVFLIKNIGGKK